MINCVNDPVLLHMMCFYIFTIYEENIANQNDTHLYMYDGRIHREKRLSTE